MSSSSSSSGSSSSFFNVEMMKCDVLYNLVGWLKM